MRLLLPIALALTLASCSLQARLIVTDEGPARIVGQTTWEPETQAAWATLRDLDPTLPPDPFAASLWRQGLGPRAKIVPTPRGTSVDFPVVDPAKLLPGWRRTADQWTLILDRETLRGLAALTTWSGSPALAALVPSPGAAVSETEYRDLLVYLLGSNSTGAVAATLVDASTVELTVEVPRAIRSAPGALTVHERTAVYRWPLVRVLALEKPVTLSVSF